LRYLTTLYINDHRARISLQKRALIVAGGEGTRTRIPLNELESVVLVGNAQVSTQALAACAAARVKVSSLSRGGKVQWSTTGPTTGNVHLRVAQCHASERDGDRLALARWFVAGKLQNGRRLLKQWASDGQDSERKHLLYLQGIVEERLANLSNAHDGDKIRGIEGDGTRVLFKGMRRHLHERGAAFEFETRNRRPPRDPVNALLGFVYGLLLAEVTGALESVGLDPQIGFLHGLRPGRPSLALDLIEEFRPSVAERFVSRLLCRRQVGPDHFVVTAGGACYLNDDGRPVVLKAYDEFKSASIRHPLLSGELPRSALPIVQATLLARYLRGDLDAYAPYVMIS